MSIVQIYLSHNGGIHNWFCGIVEVISNSSGYFFKKMNQHQPLRNLSINEWIQTTFCLVSDEYLELEMLFLTIGRFVGLWMIASVFRVISLVYLAEYIETDSVQM